MTAVPPAVPMSATHNSNEKGQSVYSVPFLFHMAMRHTVSAIRRVRFGQPMVAPTGVASAFAFYA